MIYIFLISGLFIGWSMGANDTGNIFGAAVSTRMIRFRQAALIASVFYFLGAVLEGSGPSGTLGRLGSVDALGGAFTVALAAALAILVIVRLGIPVSVSQTIVGALIGWNYFSGRLTNFGSLLTIASSWITAFVVAAGITANPLQAVTCQFCGACTCRPGCHCRLRLCKCGFRCDFRLVLNIVKSF